MNPPPCSTIITVPRRFIEVTMTTVPLPAAFTRLLPVLKRSPFHLTCPLLMLPNLLSTCPVDGQERECRLISRAFSAAACSASFLCCSAARRSAFSCSSLFFLPASSAFLFRSSSAFSLAVLSCSAFSFSSLSFSAFSFAFRSSSSFTRYPWI